MDEYKERRNKKATRKSQRTERVREDDWLKFVGKNVTKKLRNEWIRMSE